MHTETLAEYLGRSKGGYYQVKVYPFQQEPYIESFMFMRDAERFLYTFREYNPKLETLS